jgi:hypothetical protein
MQKLKTTPDPFLYLGRSHGANDAGAREAIVESAMVSAEDRRQQAKAGRRSEQEPRELAGEGTTKVKGSPSFGRDYFDASRHFPHRLASGRERDKVRHVLNEKEGEQRSTRQQIELREPNPANPHREVHNRGIDGAKDETIDRERCQSSDHRGVLILRNDRSGVRLIHFRLDHRLGNR